MATDKKISTLVQSQLPQYLTEEGPNLVAFLRAYYEWMETNGQVLEQNKNLIVNQDIDTTNLAKFYSYFQREVLCDFPDEILADKRLVAKRIKDLYRSKGSPASYNLLFRILYNQNVSIYKPSENILRASDGRWTQDTIIRLGAPFAGNLEQAVGKIVTGDTSGAKGKVLKVLTVFEGGVEVKQLRLIEVVGTFVDLEKVSTPDNLSGFVVNTIGPLSDVLFGSAGSVGGTGHQPGDTVTFSSATGTGATGFIRTTTDEVITFSLVDGGSGYRVNDTVVTVSGGQPKLGLTGSVSVTAINNEESIFAYTDSIQGLKDTPIGFGPTYSSNSGVISSNLASSNSSTALNAALGVISVNVGSISSISVTSGNYANNSVPSIAAVDAAISALDLPDGSGGFKGRNAVFQATYIPGSIQDVDVTQGGRLYNAIDLVTITNTSRLHANGAPATTPATGDPVVSGVIAEDGSYKGTKGFLSWDQRLQDNYYYQEFSYVLNSELALRTYRDVVRDVIHPAGTKLFGQVNFDTEVDLTGLSVEQLVSTDLIGGRDGVPSIGPNTVFGTTQLDRNMYINTIASTTAVGILEAGDQTDVYLDANGFIYVSNTNVISHYLGLPITEFLDDPVIIGTPFVVVGDGTDDFTTILTGGTEVEITDVTPGTSGNTSYIVNTVFSNTVFSLNTAFTGGSMANGIFRYTYNGNI